MQWTSKLVMFKGMIVVYFNYIILNTQLCRYLTIINSIISLFVREHLLPIFSRNFLLFSLFTKLDMLFFSYSFNDNLKRIELACSSCPHFACILQTSHQTFINKSLSESSAPMLWKAKGRRRKEPPPDCRVLPFDRELVRLTLTVDSMLRPQTQQQPAAMWRGLRNPDSGSISVCGVTLSAHLSSVSLFFVSMPNTEVSICINSSYNHDG